MTTPDHPLVFRDRRNFLNEFFFRSERKIELKIRFVGRGRHPEKLRVQILEAFH